MTEELGYLIYRSRANIALASLATARICLVSRRLNGQAGITGYLHRQDGWFVQYLEGPNDALDATMARIARDNRHDRVEVLETGLLPARRFSDWNMAYSDRTVGPVDGIPAGVCPPIARADVDELLDFFLGTSSRMAAE